MLWCIDVLCCARLAVEPSPVLIHLRYPRMYTPYTTTTISALFLLIFYHTTRKWRSRMFSRTGTLASQLPRFVAVIRIDLEGSAPPVQIPERYLGTYTPTLYLNTRSEFPYRAMDSSPAAVLPSASVVTNEIPKTQYQNEFKHEPLDHTQPSIRFISMLSELSSEGLVQCKLKHFIVPELRDPIMKEYMLRAGRRRNICVRYTCLSYVWGHKNDNGGPFPILINGQKFYVFYNLHEFLKIAREKYNRRRLWWIDAICLDQTNIEEKNHQVQLMGVIYYRAKRVIVWLGEDPRVGHVLAVFERDNTLESFLAPFSVLSEKTRYRILRRLQSVPLKSTLPQKYGAREGNMQT